MGTELQAKYQKLAQEYAKVTKLHILSVLKIAKRCFCIRR